MPTYSGPNFEKCDVCGRFGAKKYVEDLGPNGLGGRQTQTRWMCELHESDYRRGQHSKQLAKQATIVIEQLDERIESLEEIKKKPVTG